MHGKLIAELHDLFRFENGDAVTSTADWSRRRQELLTLLRDVEYGPLPPAPPWVRGEELNDHFVESLAGAHHTQYRLVMGSTPPFLLYVDMLIPPGSGPFPVIINGDACWRYVTEGISAAVLARRIILVQFNRTAIVPDVASLQRTTGLYGVYPDSEFAALSAWAWGYHRCVDFLQTLPCVDKARIAITGHSRGGKAVLLAGATDERIALTAPNDSGCGGAGCFRWKGPECEQLSDIVTRFPHWFSPQLASYIGREHLLPVDQHALKAAVAPRLLLTTEALGDLWANPSGTYQTHLAAREVYRFLGAEEKIAIWYRAGGHSHSQADWTALLDFIDWQWCGSAPAQRFNDDPFADLPPAFHWTAPPEAAR
jgi:hypothetical protein